MKKLLSLVIAVMVLMSFMSASASGFTAEVESVQAKCGDTVTVNITLNDNPGIITAVFSLFYDQSRLELVGATDKGLLSMGVFSQAHSTYPFILSWYSASSTDFDDDGVLAELKFHVLEDAEPGEAFVNLEFDENDVFDYELENVELTVKNGSVYVEGKALDDSGEQDSESDDSENGSTNTNNSNTVKNDNSSSRSSSRGGSSGGTTVSQNTSTVQNSSANDDANNTIVFTIDKKEAVVFGKTKTNDVAPIIRFDRTMLPARFVAENLGAEVSWDNESKKVTVKKDTTEIILYIGSDEAFVNGEKKLLDSAAFIENDRTYTPLRFIAENLGADVNWNGVTREVTITTRK